MDARRDGSRSRRRLAGDHEGGWIRGWAVWREGRLEPARLSSRSAERSSGRWSHGDDHGTAGASGDPHAGGLQAGLVIARCAFLAGAVLAGGLAREPG